MSQRREAPVYGYFHVCRNLISDLTRMDDWLFAYIFPAILAVLVLISIFCVPIDDYGLPIRIMMIMLLLAPLAALLYLLLIVSTTFIGTRDPTRLATRIAVRLIACETHPFSSGRGLVYQDVERLKRVAKIEQGAAGWRSALVNVTIIGTTTAVLSTLAFLGRDIVSVESLWTWLQEKQPDIQFAWNLFDAMRIVTWPLSILIIWGACKLYNYLYTFLATESANRAVLLACEEVMALLEQCHLTGVNEFAFREKRALVEKFGWQIVPPEDASFWQVLRGGRIVTDTSGKKWMLVPSGKGKETNHFSN